MTRKIKDIKKDLEEAVKRQKAWEQKHGDTGETVFKLGIEKYSKELKEAMRL